GPGEPRTRRRLRGQVLADPGAMAGGAPGPSGNVAHTVLPGSPEPAITPQAAASCETTRSPRPWSWSGGGGSSSRMTLPSLWSVTSTVSVAVASFTATVKGVAACTI